MNRFQIPAALLLSFSMASALHAQNVASGGSDDVFDTTEADADFLNVDRSGAVGSAGSVTVGSSTAGGTNSSTGAGGFGAGGFGGGGFGGLGSLFNAFNNGGGQATQSAIRTRLRSAIEVAPRSPQLVQQVATERFMNVAGKPSLRGIRVRMEGRTAILIGTVASERDRRMSQLLVQLEPGVAKVENRIVVVK